MQNAAERILSDDVKMHFTAETRWRKGAQGYVFSSQSRQTYVSKVPNDGVPLAIGAILTSHNGLSIYIPQRNLAR